MQELIRPVNLLLVTLFLPIVSNAGVMDTLNSISNAMNIEWVIPIVVIVIEFLLRVFKTSDPKSLLYYTASFFKLLAKICDRIGGVLDQVLQRIKEEPKVEEKK